MPLSVIYCINLHTSPLSCKIAHSGGKEGGLAPKWELKRNSDAIDSWPVHVQFFLIEIEKFGKFSRRNFWRRSVSGIALGRKGGKMRVAGQKVMEAEGDSDLFSSPLSLFTNKVAWYLSKKCISGKYDSRNWLRWHFAGWGGGGCGDSESSGLFLHQWVRHRILLRGELGTSHCLLKR